MEGLATHLRIVCETVPAPRPFQLDTHKSKRRALLVRACHACARAAHVRARNRSRWDQGLLGMCVGEKRKLVIPPELGYGDSGAGAKIPGGAVLVFEVELVNIDRKSEL